MIKIIGGNEMDLDISKLEFEERVDSEVYGTTILYFIGPKELISYKHPEAESAEIMIEFNTNNPHGQYPEITISPTKGGRDYDWYYAYIDDPDLVKRLIEIGLSGGKEKNERTL